MFIHRISLLGVTMAALVVTPALAQKQYRPGVSDTEIKIGQTIAYSGPASAYGTLGKVEAAYFKWLNEPRAASTAARSTSSAATMPTRPRKQWRIYAAWSKVMRSRWSSACLERR